VSSWFQNKNPEKEQIHNFGCRWSVMLEIQENNTILIDKSIQRAATNEFKAQRFGGIAPSRTKEQLNKMGNWDKRSSFSNRIN
jgi:hypothetical protein